MYLCFILCIRLFIYSFFLNECIKNKLDYAVNHKKGEEELDKKKEIEKEEIKKVRDKGGQETE